MRDPIIDSACRKLTFLSLWDKELVVGVGQDFVGILPSCDFAFPNALEDCLGTMEHMP